MACYRMKIWLPALVAALWPYSLLSAESNLTEQFWDICATNKGRIDWSADRAKERGYQARDPVSIPEPERFDRIGTYSRVLDDEEVIVETFVISDTLQFASLCRVVQSGEADLSSVAYNFVKEMRSVFDFPHGGDPTIVASGSATWILSDPPYYSAISVSEHSVPSNRMVSIAYLTQYVKQ